MTTKQKCVCNGVQQHQLENKLDMAAAASYWLHSHIKYRVHQCPE